jgi:hypothetical protein
MTSKDLPGDFEQRALELLPWYVNGTLQGEERELVGHQVLASLTCRKELERLRRLHQLMQRDDAEAVATDREFDRLMARIHASEASPQSAAAVARRGFPWMPYALAASVAASASALLWWGTLTPSASPHTYETLTNPAPADAAAARLRVLFAPGVTGAEQRELLDSHGLTAVSPPAEDGVVTLAFPGSADRAAIVAALKRDPRIRLVTTPPGSDGP